MLYIRGKQFDYSAMDPFHNPDQEAPPPYLAVGRPRGAKGPFLSSNLRPLIEDLSFQDSRSSVGIQIADVLASAFCRACNGRLRERGWARLGGIMIKHAEDGQAVEYLSLSDTSMRPGRAPYGNVVRRIEDDARPFTVPRP